jgi:hypothetical protein
MNYEPLKQKKQDIIKQKTKTAKKNDEFNQGFEQGVEDSFKMFASYVEMYNRYKEDVKLLMKEQKPLWKEWVTFFEKQNKVDKTDYLPLYKSWLFEYIFHDVNNEKTDGYSLF